MLGDLASALWGVLLVFEYLTFLMWQALVRLQHHDQNLLRELRMTGHIFGCKYPSDHSIICSDVESQSIAIGCHMARMYGIPMYKIIHPHRSSQHSDTHLGTLALPHPCSECIYIICLSCFSSQGVTQSSGKLPVVRQATSAMSEWGSLCSKGHPKRQTSSSSIQRGICGCLTICKQPKCLSDVQSQSHAPELLLQGACHAKPIAIASETRKGVHHVTLRARQGRQASPYADHTQNREGPQTV